DGGLGRSGDLDLDVELAPDLDAGAGDELGLLVLADQAGGEEGLGRDQVALDALGGAGEGNRDVLDAGGVVAEAAAGQALPERELATLEERALVQLAAGTRAFALVTAATGLAGAGADAATEADLDLAAGVGGGDLLEA